MVSTVLKGRIRGKMIELDQAPELPDGQEVSVTLRTELSEKERRACLLRAFGSWAEGGEELDRFMEQLRQDRKIDRPELDL